MENLDLLIEIGIYLGALSLGFLLARLSDASWNFFSHIKLFIIYRKTMKKNQLHEPDNPFMKEVNKLRLMDGKYPYLFHEYNSHFIDGKWYGD